MCIIWRQLYVILIGITYCHVTEALPWLIGPCHETLKLNVNLKGGWYTSFSLKDCLDKCDKSPLRSDIALWFNDRRCKCVMHLNSSSLLQIVDASCSSKKNVNSGNKLSKRGFFVLFLHGPELVNASLDTSVTLDEEDKRNVTFHGAISLLDPAFTKSLNFRIEAYWFSKGNLVQIDQYISADDRGVFVSVWNCVLKSSRSDIRVIFSTGLSTKTVKGTFLVIQSDAPQLKMSILAPRIPRCIPPDFQSLIAPSIIFVQDEVLLLSSVLPANTSGRVQWILSDGREMITDIVNGTSRIVHKFLEEGIYNVSVKVVGSVYQTEAEFRLVAVHEIKIVKEFQKPLTALEGVSTKIELAVLIAGNGNWIVNLKCEEFRKREEVVPSYAARVCEITSINLLLKFHVPGLQQCVISVESNNLSRIKINVSWFVYSSAITAVIETKSFAKLGERVPLKLRIIPEIDHLENKVSWKISNQITNNIEFQCKLVSNATLNYVFNSTGCFDVQITVFNIFGRIENSTKLCVQDEVQISSIYPSAPIIYVKSKHEVQFATYFIDNFMVRCLWTFRCQRIRSLQKSITFEVEKCDFYQNFSTAASCIVSLTVRNDVSEEHFWELSKIYVEDPVVSITPYISDKIKIGSVVQLQLATEPANKDAAVEVEVNAHYIKPVFDTETSIYTAQKTFNTSGINLLKFRAYNNVSHVVIRQEVFVLPELEPISIEHFGCPRVGYPMRFLARSNGNVPGNSERLLYLWTTEMLNETSQQYTSIPLFQTKVLNSTGKLSVSLTISDGVNAKFAKTSLDILDEFNAPCLHHNAISEVGKETEFSILGLSKDHHCRVSLKLEIMRGNNIFRIFPSKVTDSEKDDSVERWRYNFQSSGFHGIMGLVFLKCSDSSRNLAFQTGIHVQERLISVHLTGPKFLYLKRHPLQNKWNVDVKPNVLGNVFIWNILNEEKVTAVPDIFLSNQILPGQYKLQLKVSNGLGYLQGSMIFEAAVALLLLNYTITDFFTNEYGVITLHINQIVPVPNIFIDFGDNVTCHLDLEECSFEYEAVDGALMVNIAHTYASSGVYDVYFNASSTYGAFEQYDVIIVEEHIDGVDLILLSPTVVSLFEKVVVMCTVENGTNLNFEWDFGEYMDDQYTVVHSFAKNSTAYHSYGIADVYNISVTVYNNYEEVTLFLNHSVQAVEEIKDLHVQPLSGFYAVPLLASKSDSEVGGDYATDPVKFKASVWRGSDVQFLFDFGDGTTELVLSQPPLWDFTYAIVKHTYFSEGVYDVYVTATNLLDSVKTKLDLPFYVQFAPEGLKLNKLYYIVEYGSNLTMQASLTHGTNVSFNWHVGDEYFTDAGDTLFLRNINPGIYEVIVEAYNEVTDFSSKSLSRPTFSSKIYVQERLEGIDVCLIFNETEMCGSTMLELPSDEIVVFKAKTTPSTESYLRFIWQLGIGELKRTNSPYLRHRYQHAGWYQVNVTAQNHISSASSLVLRLHLVQKIANLTSIHSQGPNLVNYPVTYSVFYWFGTNLTFQWDFGDGSLPVTTNTSSVSHTYNKVGEYWISVNVWNKFSHANISTNTFFLHQVCQKPKITFLHTRNRIAKYGEDLLLEADIAIFCQQTNVYYTWDIEGLELSSLNSLTTLHQRQLIIPAYFLPVGSYGIHLKVQMIGTIVYGTATAVLEVESPIPSISIDGGFVRCLGYNDTIQMKAKYISNLNESNSLSYQWSCSPKHQGHLSCFHSTSPLAFLSNNFSQFALPASYFSPGLSAVVINVAANNNKIISASQVVEIHKAQKVLMLNIYCSGCHKFGVNQDDTVRLKVSCSNCEVSTTKYNWKIWVIEDSGYRIHFSNYECVQADGSTFFIMAPNSTSDSSLRNVTFVQNDEESFTIDHISKDMNASEKFPPFPSLPEFPEDPKAFHEIKESSGQERQLRLKRNSLTFQDADAMDFLPFPDAPLEGRAHYDDNLTWNIDPEFLPNPVPDLLDPDYLITEEGLPGEGGSAAARHQSSHRFGLDENTIFEGAGMPRTKSADDYNALENDLFSFGDPVRDNTVDQKLPPPHLVNRPKTLLSLNTADTTTGFNSDTLILKPGILKVGHSYLAQVNAIIEDNNQEGFAMEYFKVHVGPINGRCTLMPLSGYSLNFDFRLHCLEWKTDHSALYYEIRYSFEEGEAGHLIYFGLNENIRFTLPAGHKHNSHHVYLNVLVRDNVGAPTKVCSLNREVKPLPLNTSILQYVHNEISHPRSILKKLLGEKHNQAALHQIHVLVSSLNNVEEHDEPALHSKNQQLHKSIIHSLLDCLNDLKIATKVEATQMLSVLSEIISSKQNINLFELQKAYNIFDKLKKQREKLYNFFATELFKHGLLTFLSKLAFAANSKLVKNAELITIAREHMLEEIIAKMRNRLKTEEPISIRTPHSYISAVYINEENEYLPNYLQLDQIIIPVTKKTYLSPVLEKSRFKRCMDETCNYAGSCAILVLHEFDYVTLFPSKSSMQLFSSEERAVLITLLSCDKMVDITMQRKKSLDFSAYFARAKDSEVQNRSILTKEYMNVHQINISEEDVNFPVVFHLSLDISDHSNSVDVLFRYESLPTLHHYDFKKSFSIHSNDTTVFISPDKIKAPGVYFFGVLSTPFVFDKTYKEAVCAYSAFVWKDVCLGKSSTSWSVQNCIVLGSSNYSFTKCSCSVPEMTAYSIPLQWELLLVPNIELLETGFNPFPVIVFVTLFIIYCLCIFANFQRKKNVRLPSAPVSLKDNCSDHKQLYLIYVSTGMFSSAGTTASVFIVLHGAKGVTETRQLIGSDCETISFQKGSVDMFLLSTQDNLGPLMKIEVWHNNYGPSPSWYLNNIVIKDVKTEGYYHFDCYNWLAVDKDDGQIERELPIAESLPTFKQVLYRNMITFIYDFNMWNVLYFESPTSYFTASQRLTCCLCSCVNIALLLCIFQDDIFAELEEYDILHLTWETLLFCFYISAAVSMLQLIYTTLFRFSTPPPVNLDPKFSNVFNSFSLDTFNCWLKNKLSSSNSTTDRSSMEDSGSLYSSEHSSSSLSVPDALGESFSSIEKDALEFSVAFSDVSESISPLQNISSTWQACENWLRKKHNLISSYDLTLSDIQLSDTEKQNDDIVLDQFSIEDPNNRMEAAVENIDDISAASNSNLTSGTHQKDALFCDTVSLDESLNAQFLFPTLPSFFYYAAWWIVVCNTLASAFVTLQYSSRFSTSFCIYWLQCIFIAVLCSCLMITPVMVFLMACIYSIKCCSLSKTQDPCSSEDSCSNKDQNWLFGSQPSFARMEYFKKYLRPPREQILEQFRRYCIKEKITFSFYSETSQFLLIFVLLMFLMLPEDTNERYHHRRAIQNAFLKPKNSFLKHTHHSKEAVKSWLENDFLNGFYGSADFLHNDQEYAVEYLTSSRLVGTSIFKYYNSSSSCDTPCSSSSEENSKHFRNDSHRCNFCEEKSLDGSYGEYFISRSSNLSRIKFEGMDQVRDLINWLDSPSVAATVEFMLFNPVFSLLTCVSFLLEVFPQGTITIHLDTSSVRISDITNTSHHLKFIVLLIYFCVTAFNCKNHLWKILQNKSKYLKEKWNFHACTFFATSILYIIFYVCYLLEFNHTVNELKVTQFELNIDIKRIIYFETAIRSLNAVLIFLHLIRSFKIFYFSSRLQRILKKLSYSCREISTLFFGLLLVTFIFNIIAKQCAFMETISPHPLLVCLKSIDSLFPDHNRSEIVHSESIVRTSLYFFISLFMLIIHVYLFSFIRSVLISHRGSKMQSYEKVSVKDSVQMIKRRCLRHFQTHAPQLVDEADFELPVDFLLVKLERIADILVAKADVLFPNQDESYKNEICDTFITEILEDFAVPCSNEVEMPQKADEKEDLNAVFQECDALNIEKIPSRLIATMPRQSKPKPRAYLPTSFHSSLNSERRFKNNMGTSDVSVLSQHKIRKTYPLFHIDSDSSSQTSSDQKKDLNNCSIRKTKSRGKGKSDVLDVLCDST